MANLNMRYQVAVIDEIQMMGDPARGWAWTQAVLGLPSINPRASSGRITSLRRARSDPIDPENVCDNGGKCRDQDVYPTNRARNREEVVGWRGR